MSLQRRYDGYAASARPNLVWWGRFVAQNQIAVLLGCAVVVCLVLSPAVSSFITTAATLNSFDDLKTLLFKPLDASLTSGPVALPWQGLGNIVAYEGEPCWSRVPRERLLAIQQVWLTTEKRVLGQEGEHGVLERSTLHRALKAERAVQASVTLGALPDEWRCLTAGCTLTSALDAWNRSEPELLSDPSPLTTLAQLGQQWTADDQLFFRATTLIGEQRRGGLLQSADMLAAAILLAADDPSQPLPDLDETLSGAVAPHGYAMSTPTQERHVVLRYLPSTPRSAHLRGEDATFALVYLIVGMYVYLRLRALDKVHSRPGLVLTGLIETAMSGLLSLRVCSALGLRLELVPWQMLPFLVVVLGVDNIYIVTQAVSATSVELTLPERMGEGFARVGFPLFLTFLLEIAMAVGAFIVLPVGGGWREISGFAAVALVTDYLLQATFFLTVLSIDMQRLELADLLKQGAVSLTVARQRAASVTRLPNQPVSSWDVLQKAMRHTMESRLARTYTFISLLLINLMLYLRHGAGYLSPQICGTSIEPPLLASTDSPEARYWALLSGSAASAVHIVIKKPFVAILSSTPTRPAVRSMPGHLLGPARVHLIRGVLLPSAVVVGLLYLLLIYLIKDADVLATEKARAAKARADQEQAARERQQSPRAVVEKLHVAGSSDIELTATARNVCVAWSTFDSHLKLYRLGESSGSTYEKIRLPAEVSLVAMTIDVEGSYVAAATANGDLLCFSVADLTQLPAASSTSSVTSSSVIFLFAQSPSDPSSAPPPGRNSATDRAVFYAVHADGAISRVTCQNGQASVVAESRQSRPGVRLRCFVSAPTAQRPFDGHAVVRQEEPLSMAVWRFIEDRFKRVGEVDLELGEEITAAAVAVVPFTGSSATLVALGLRDGRVAVHQLRDESSERLCVLQGSAGKPERVRQIRLIGVPSHSCRRCGDTIADAVNASWSVGPTLITKRIYRPAVADARACQCSPPVSSPLRVPSPHNGEMTLAPPGSPSRLGDEGLMGIVPLHGAGRRASQYRREASADVSGALLTPPASPALKTKTLSESLATDVRVSTVAIIAVEADAAWGPVGRFLIAIRRRRGVSSMIGGDSMTSRALAARLGGFLAEWELVSMDAFDATSDLPTILADPLNESEQVGHRRSLSDTPSRSRRRRDPLSTCTPRPSEDDDDPTVHRDVLPFGRGRLLTPVAGDGGRATVVLGNALAIIDGSAQAWSILLANGHANGSALEPVRSRLSTPTRKVQ